MPMLDLNDSKIIAEHSTTTNIFPPEFFDSLKSINDLTESILEPIRIINEGILISFQKSFDDLNKNFGLMLVAQMQSVNFADKFRNYPPTQVIDVESTEISVPLISASNALDIVNNFEDFSIGISVEGRFYYEEKQIHGLTLGSNHGRFLKMLLEAEFNYVSDEYALRILNPSDKEKGIGFIRDDLVKILRNENSLELNLYRNRKQGYKLMSIQPQAN